MGVKTPATRPLKDPFHTKAISKSLYSKKYVLFLNQSDYLIQELIKPQQRHLNQNLKFFSCDASTYRIFSSDVQFLLVLSSFDGQGWPLQIAASEPLGLRSIFCLPTTFQLSPPQLCPFPCSAVQVLGDLFLPQTQLRHRTSWWSRGAVFSEFICSFVPLYPFVPSDLSELANLCLKIIVIRNQLILQITFKNRYTLFRNCEH